MDENGAKYECVACGATFESREAMLRHTYDIGLVD
jgi:DNA-directed RNA polymerase subunit RPC12/RpoP